MLFWFLIHICVNKLKKKIKKKIMYSAMEIWNKNSVSNFLYVEIEMGKQKWNEWLINK